MTDDFSRSVPGVVDEQWIKEFETMICPGGNDELCVGAGFEFVWFEEFVKASDEQEQRGRVVAELRV